MFLVKWAGPDPYTYCFLILSHFASNVENFPTPQQSVHLSVAQPSFPCQGVQVMRVKGVDMPQQCKTIPSRHGALPDFCSCCVCAYPGQQHMYFQRMLTWVKSHRVTLSHFMFSNSSPFSQNPAPRGTGNLCEFPLLSHYHLLISVFPLLTPWVLPSSPFPRAAS